MILNLLGVFGKLLRLTDDRSHFLEVRQDAVEKELINGNSVEDFIITAVKIKRENSKKKKKTFSTRGGFFLLLLK